MFLSWDFTNHNLYNFDMHHIYTRKRIMDVVKIILVFFIIKVAVSKKNNVLFLIMDDFKAVLSDYGDSNAYTPNIDKLAAQSFVFTKVYAQQALCAPSRNSLLTSRRPDSLRLYDFYSYWRQTVGNFTSLPQYFKEHGYHTHSVGKIFHPGISSNYCDDQPYSWSQEPFHPKTIKFKNAKVCTNPDGTLSKNLICPVITKFQPQGILPDIESMEESTSFLKYRNKSKPYFLAVGFHKPHIPFKFPESYLDFHPIENITLPTNRVRPSLLPDVAWNPWIDIRERDDIKKLNIPFPYGPISDDVTRKIIQSYYASVSYVDDLIGEVLREVNFRDTVIVLTSDHGWSLGQHGEFSKYSNFGEATHVPMIIHVPLLSTKKIFVESLVELVDIFPTLVDVTQISEPLIKCPQDKNLILCTEGASLLPVMLEALDHQRVKGKSAVFSQYPRPGPHPTLIPDTDRPRLEQIQIMSYSMITRRYRYGEWVAFNPKNLSANWNKIYGKELYDHSLDPDENLNLADRSELQKLIKYLRKRLRLGWPHV